MHLFYQHRLVDLCTDYTNFFGYTNPSREKIRVFLRFVQAFVAAFLVIEHVPAHHLGDILRNGLEISQGPDGLGALYELRRFIERQLAAVVREEAGHRQLVAG